MRRSTLPVLVSLLFVICSARGVLADGPTATPTSLPIAGTWEGVLDAGPTKLRIGVAIKQDPAGALTATMDSIDQGAKGIPIDAVSFKDGALDFTIAAVGGSYHGTASPDGKTIAGHWTQGVAMALDFARVESATKLSRPQEPKPPLPYTAEEVAWSYDPTAGVEPSFQANATREVASRISLAGTLTLPLAAGPHPAVILITGSGPEDRDETIFGHKPFLVIADHLTRHGIAVLRFDDRGVGGSTGASKTATSEDFADDVRAALRFLKGRNDIDGKRIGLVGHSEGGLIAPMVAASSPDVAFIVLLAGPGVPGALILAEQGRLISKAMGKPAVDIERDSAMQRRIFDIVTSGLPEAEMHAKLEFAIGMAYDVLSDPEKKAVGDRAAFVAAQLAVVVSPWMRAFLAYDPRPTLAKVKVPVLAMNGGSDLQVPPGQNLPEILAALEAGGCPDVTIAKLPRLNHLFQHSDTGSVADYGSIEETFAPIALGTLSDWITARFVAPK